MRIGIDMDGVMVDTINHAAVEISKLLGYQITPDDVAHNLGEIEGIDEIFAKYGDEILCALNPMDNVTDVLKELKKEHELYIISARFNQHYDASLKWLDKHGICVDNVIFTEGKGKANICTGNGIELMVEDSARNAIEVADSGVKVLLLKTDYNRHINKDGIAFCENWIEIGAFIKDFTADVAV